jgi:hypothetical protein
MVYRFLLFSCLLFPFFSSGLAEQQPISEQVGLSLGNTAQSLQLEQPIPGFEEWLAKGWDEQVGFKEEKIVISLGYNCAAARHFQENYLSAAYYPFDWCFSEFESVYNAIRDDFKGFLEVLTATPIKYREMIDETYKIRFVHDFKVDVGEEVLIPDYGENKAKYDRRINRFRGALQSKKKIFFFRTMITKPEAILLRNLITEKHPQLDYTLVVINKTDDFKEPWNEKNMSNFFLATPETASLTDEMKKEWGQIFRKLGLIN